MTEDRLNLRPRRQLAMAVLIVVSSVLLCGRASAQVNHLQPAADDQKAAKAAAPMTLSDDADPYSRAPPFPYLRRAAFSANARIHPH